MKQHNASLWQDMAVPQAYVGERWKDIQDGSDKMSYTRSLLSRFRKFLPIASVVAKVEAAAVPVYFLHSFWVFFVTDQSRRFSDTA